MFRLFRFFTSAAFFTVGWLALQPAPATESLPTASAAATGSATSVPFGWVDFCRRYAGECGGPATPSTSISPRAARSEIDRVNRWVNAHVEPVSDMDHWGLVDRWDYPSDGRGDCEDYALLKRKMLIDMGFPRQALLMTGQGRGRGRPRDPDAQDQQGRIRARQPE